MLGLGIYDRDKSWTELHTKGNKYHHGCVRRDFMKDNVEAKIRQPESDGKFYRSLKRRRAN